jgi:hypothetical protein
MLHNRGFENGGNAWVPEQPALAIPAGYRRGILRAKVTVSDLTCWSARMDSMERLKPGMTVWLALPGLEPKLATVTWSEGFSAGLRFAEPLHPAVLDAVIEGRTARLH